MVIVYLNGHNIAVMVTRLFNFLTFRGSILFAFLRIVLCSSVQIIDLM